MKRNPQNFRPLVSIGLATKNRAPLLTHALKTLSSQTYTNIELIISDNASDDTTQSICTKFEKQDTRIVYYRQQADIGASNNFDFVLQKARGKYFMWAADDDSWDKRYIEKIVSELEKHPSSVLGVSALKEYSGKNSETILLNSFKRFEKTSEALKKFLLHPKYIAGMFYGIYRTSIIQKLGLHKDSRPYFGGTGDILTIFALLLRGDLIYIPEPLFHKHDTGYYSSINQELELLNFSHSVASHIKTYLLFPIGHCLDFYYAIIYTLRSQLSIKDKSFIIVYCVLKFLRDITTFIIDIARGTCLVLRGFMKGLLDKLNILLNDDPAQ